jgi:hypothetical protein
VTEVECTRDRGEGQLPNAFALLPPCSCPRCAPEGLDVLDLPDGFTRVSGRQQRLRVEPVDLGPNGRALLG